MSDSLGFELVSFQGTHRWEFGYSPAGDVLSWVSGPDGSAYRASLFGDRFCYIGPVGGAKMPCRGSIGTSQLRHPTTDSLDLKRKAEAWLAEISPLCNRNSRAWPIITALLALAPGLLLLVEHPVQGLHSKAIVGLGSLFSLAACAGIQVILETHSDQRHEWDSSCSS